MRFGRWQAGGANEEAALVGEPYGAPTVPGGGAPVERAAVPEAAVPEAAVPAEIDPLDGAGLDGAGLDAAGLDPAELDARKAALEDVLDLMRPAVQMDGGDLALVDADYVAGIVEVRLEGACGSCAISSSTLQGGVERLLRERLPWVREVRGGVDDSLDPFESAALGRGAYVPRFE